MVKLPVKQSIEPIHRPWKLFTCLLFPWPGNNALAIKLSSKLPRCLQGGWCLEISMLGHHQNSCHALQILDVHLRPIPLRTHRCRDFRCCKVQRKQLHHGARWSSWKQQSSHHSGFEPCSIVQTWSSNHQRSNSQQTNWLCLYGNCVPRVLGSSQRLSSSFANVGWAAGQQRPALRCWQFQLRMVSQLCRNRPLACAKTTHELHYLS